MQNRLICTWCYDMSKVKHLDIENWNKFCLVARKNVNILLICVSDSISARKWRRFLVRAADQLIEVLMQIHYWRRRDIHWLRICFYFDVFISLRSCVCSVALEFPQFVKWLWWLSPCGGITTLLWGFFFTASYHGCRARPLYCFTGMVNTESE